MNNDDRILQIIPAPGLFALYRDTGLPGDQLDRCAVIALALVETGGPGGPREVRALVAVERCFEFAEEPRNFAGFEHEGEQGVQP